MCSVRLIINEPETANINTSGWSCHGPIGITPNQRLLPIASYPAAMAMTITSNSELGIGVLNSISASWIILIV